jgi:hypothetical protein
MYALHSFYVSYGSTRFTTFVKNIISMKTFATFTRDPQSGRSREQLSKKRSVTPVVGKATGDSRVKTVMTNRLMAKTSQSKASCKDSKKLRESWTYKTTKIISRTRHVRSCSVDVLKNASKVLRDTFYCDSYSVSDQRFQHDLIPCGQGLSFLSVFTMTIE